MATNTQMRSWWRGYWRRTDRMVRIAFPGDGRVWRLLVADKSAPIWQAVSQIMASEPYLFRESAGGTYSPREPGSTSLHPYGLAIDLNPSKNPQGRAVRNDYPPTFITRMEGIRANGKQAILWGGRWPPSNPPDAMHWQINVAPADCKLITWDKTGETPTPVPKEDSLLPITKTSSRDDIGMLQDRLYESGSTTVKTSGIYDAATAAAVKARLHKYTGSDEASPVGSDMKNGYIVNANMYNGLTKEWVLSFAAVKQ